jgi:hypothetical protein
MYVKQSAGRGISEALVFIAGIIILLMPALYNGYPFVTGDTGAYIKYAYHIMVPSDRSLVYSIFILLTSYRASLWCVLIIQSAILSFFIRLVTRHLLHRWYHPFLYLAVILIIALGTSVSWFSSEVMPDVFTGILLLALCCWYMLPMPAQWQRYLLLLTIFFCIIVHNSHLIICLLLSVILVFYYIATRNKSFASKSWRVMGVTIAGFLTMSTMNAISGKGFRPSESSHVFLMSRMVETGMMDEFLHEYCTTSPVTYKLCDYKDKLPNKQWEFMWNYQQSPLYLTGGWKANEQEYNAIIQKTLTTPKYLGLHVFKSVEGTARQLSQISIGEGLGAQKDSSTLFWGVYNNYPYEFKEYKHSMQNEGAMKPDFMNVIILVFTVLVLAISLLIASYLSISETWKTLFLLTLLFLLTNAFVTATLSTVISRFQARVFWVLPFLCVLYILQYVLERDKRTKKQVAL